MIPSINATNRVINLLAGAARECRIANAQMRTMGLPLDGDEYLAQRDDFLQVHDMLVEMNAARKPNKKAKSK